MGAIAEGEGLIGDVVMALMGREHSIREITIEVRDNDQAIATRPHFASRYTMISRSVAICTNGTRALGLGNIDPVASMPVMEGVAREADVLVAATGRPGLIQPEMVREGQVILAP